MLLYQKEDSNTNRVRVEAAFARENTNSAGCMEIKIKNAPQNKIEGLIANKL